MKRLIGRWSCAFLCAGAMGFLLPESLLFGQESGNKDDEFATRPAPKADPADFGLTLPDAPPKPGDGRVVLVKSSDDELVVAKTLVEVGDQVVVMLPDGRLRQTPTRDATPTDRVFLPVSMQELAEKLVAKTFIGFKTRTTRNYHSGIDVPRARRLLPAAKDADPRTGDAARGDSVSYAG
jgi:hypothetical protein